MRRAAAGRGRLGRGWAAPAGTGILCSVLCGRPPPPYPGALAGRCHRRRRRRRGRAQARRANEVAERRDAQAAQGCRRARRGQGRDGRARSRDQREPDPGGASGGSAHAGRVAADDRRSHARARGDPVGFLVALELGSDGWLAGGLDAVYGPIGARDFLRGRRVAIDGASGRSSWASIAPAGWSSSRQASGSWSRAARSRTSAERSRCEWATGGDALMLAYHDEEWGVPEHDDRKLFELLTLEGAQAGLYWRRPAQARGLQAGLRGLRYGRVARTGTMTGPPARRRRYRAQPGEDRGDDRQRPGASRCRTSSAASMLTCGASSTDADRRRLRAWRLPGETAQSRA